MNRRNVLKFAAAMPLFTLEACKAKEPVTTPTQTKKDPTQKFIDWVTAFTPAQGHGLIPYMSNTTTTLSTIASAKLLLFFLKIGDTVSAQKVADGLVYWIQQSKRQSSKFTRGALPSEIYLNKPDAIGDYFYASDNMITIHALNQIYRVTQKSNYAEAAVELGQWLDKNLLDGKRRDAWKTNYGPAMHYITKSGAYDNSIHTAGDFLWLNCMQDLNQLQPNYGWNSKLIQAIEFMKSAQMPSGAWYTYFQPPTNKNTQGKWFNYQGENITIGDDNLRSALAAQQFNLQPQVEKFKQWLQPYNDVLLWGYVNTDKSTPKFLPTDTPYFDVVCTGLLRSWYHKLGNNALADKCQSTLNQLQSSDGAWNWAVLQSNLQPLNAEKAVITSCWALADIV